MTSTDLDTTTGHGSALVLSADQDRWTEQQLAALRQLGVENAPAGDLAVFLHVAQRTGLDPFAKQIHMIGRNSKSWDPQTGQASRVTKYTIQTGIDGYRVIANRAAAAAGEQVEYDDTEWCGPDGQWVDAWIDPINPPVAARVVVIRNGRRYSGVAMYAEYVQTFVDQKTKEAKPNSMWAKMPAGQLAKCAEALALRRAFPNDLAALYTDDEMGQADNPPAVVQVETNGGLSGVRARQRAEKDATVPTEPLPLDGDLAAEMFGLLDALGVTDRLAFVHNHAGRSIQPGEVVTVADAHAVIAAARDLLDQPFADTPEPGIVEAEVVIAAAASEAEQ